MQALPQDGSTIEFCPVCGAVVPLTSCRQEVCTNGHTWSRFRDNNRTYNCVVYIPLTPHRTYNCVVYIPLTPHRTYNCVVYIPLTPHRTYNCVVYIPLTPHRTYNCVVYIPLTPHTHTGRCSVTLSLVHATRCRRCILCEAPANTTESFQPGRNDNSTLYNDVTMM